MDKRETVLESIKKLLSLGVSDNEIADNLYDVGIEKPEAFALIREARGPPVPIVQASQQKNQSARVTIQATSPSKSSQDLFEEIGNELSMNDQIVQQLPLDKQAQSAQVSQKVADQSSDDIANRIMSDVSKQDGEELEDDEKDLEELEEQVSNKVSSEQVSVKESTTVEQTIKTSVPSKNPIPQNIQNQSQSLADQNIKSSTPIQNQTPQVKGQASQAQPASTQAQSSKGQSTQTQSQSNVSQTFAKPIETPQQNYSQTTNASGQSFSPTTIPKMDFTQSAPSSKYSPSLEMSPDFEELWKKGIVVAVNAKLAEMKKIKGEVDAELETKVDEAVRKELYQFKVLLDSQKELIISSNKEALEQKQKEIVFIIDSKIAELKQYNKQIGDNLAAIETAKKQQELALGQINTALDDARRTKTQLIVEMNSDMIKSKSQAQSFIDTASLQLKQMDERVNKTLELEKNIADGMLQQAEQKIETLAIQRADELISNMEVELNRLQTISKKISPESLDQKISVLEEFRKQFLNSMQENLAQINTAIEELNQKNAYAERELAEKTLAIDAKLEELTKFEKEFINRMNKMLK